MYTGNLKGGYIMREGNIRDKVILALSIAGVFAGALFLSGGMCGGGGGSHYQISGSLTGR